METRRGRPRLPDDQKRRHNLPARVTTAELEWLHEKAASLGLGLSDWIRLKIFGLKGKR